MIYISELTPLCFDAAVGDKWHDTGYLHRWYYQDDILLQVLLTGGSSLPTVRLDNLTKGTTTTVSTTSYTISTGYVLRYRLIHLSQYTTDGVCRIRIGSLYYSEPFMVCSDDNLLDETTLIRVSGTTTSYKPFGVFNINGVQQIFQFRIPCGFRANGYQAKVEDESYRTQTMDIVHLWQMPYEAFTLTVGNAEGVPWWVAKYINNILCMPIVEIGDYQYKRSDDALPTMSETYEGSERFIITQLLERVPADKEGTLYLADFNDDYNSDFAI